MQNEAATAATAGGAAATAVTPAAGAAGAGAVTPLRVGVIGVGNISEQYFASFPRLPGLSLEAVADLNVERAAEVAAKQGARSLTVDELLGSPTVDVVLNLTIPAAHADVAEKALRNGKHVYSEKPLALTTADGRQVLDLAEALGLRVGSAPDTVLGTGIQTARQQLDAGVIGDAVGASAFWSAPGHERWHPAPAFYYQPGGGPLFDMGPYYLTSLVSLLGPVLRVSGTATRSSRPRSVQTGPLAGTPLTVDVDTHVTALLEHECGATSTVTVSFELWATRAPLLEVFGTLGTLELPDPNLFSGAVEVYTGDEPEWREVAVTAGYEDAGRGYGLADMAQAIATSRPHRASGELAYHVLEIMEAITNSARTTEVVTLQSTVERPGVVPVGVQPHTW